MCGPLLPVLAVASTALSAGSSIYGGIAAQGQANYQAGIASNNAIYAQRAAADAQKAGDLSVQQQQMRLADTKGRQIAAMAANGVDLSSGSALDVQKDTSVLGALDAQNIRNETAQRVNAYSIDGANFTAQAAAERASGQNSFIGGLLGGATSLIGGAASYGKNFGFPSFGSSGTPSTVLT